MVPLAGGVPVGHTISEFGVLVEKLGADLTETHWSGWLIFNHATNPGSSRS
jgi:hypothetical protein